MKTTHCFLGPRHSDNARPSILPSLLLGTFKLKPPASPLVSDQPSLHGLFESGVKIFLPGEENVDPGVSGDDDDEREKEDLAVVQRVVDVRPVVRAECP